jgi:hypothetical protein
MRAYTKALPVIAKEENGVVPRFYARILAECDDFIIEVWEDKEGRYGTFNYVLPNNSITLHVQ